MKHILKLALLSLLLHTHPVLAKPASDESIKQLLVIIEAKSLINGMKNQIENLMNKSIDDALQHQTPNAKQIEAINLMKARLVAALQEQLVWEKLEPMYLQIYKESLTEEEVSGIVSFYKTPAGQAMIKKLPLIMQKLMPEIQKMSAGIAPQIRRIQEEFIADMKAAEE